MSRILLVDDDSPTRQVLRTLFEDEGYVVDEAQDVTYALAALHATGRVYVVVIDLFLPQMAGISLLNAIDRDLALTERHAFVATSASVSSVAPQVYTMLAGLHIPLVPKPFDVETISDTVAAAAASLMPWPHVPSEAILHG